MATEMVPVETPVLRIAGGIIHRSTQHGDEIMVVYRKREQDWTLPKGEVKDSESFQDAALREVESETGCTCRLGNYLGTISFADNGIPKVVMFWKMTVILENGVPVDSNVVGEAVWLPLPAAIQRLSHAQEKSLLSRLGSIAAKSASATPAPRVQETVQPQATQVSAPQPVTSVARPQTIQAATTPLAGQSSITQAAVTPAPPAPPSAAPGTNAPFFNGAQHVSAPSTAPTPSAPQTAAPIQPPPASANYSPTIVRVASAPAVSSPLSRKRASLEDERVRDRLLRESEAFRVELAFLERRAGASDRSWADAAHEQLDNVMRCLEANDIEGGLFGLNAAQRFAVYGLNKSEIITRAYILREQALKIAATSWRGEAIDNLLAVSEEQLTADRLVDAMKLRDEESTNQHYRTRLTGDHLRILLVICSAAVIAFLPFMLLSGQVRLVGPVLLFGLLGSCFGAAQALMRGKGESMIPNMFVMLTPVLFGGAAGLAAFGIHEYLSGLYGFTHTHWGALLGMAFLFGLLGQRILAHFTGGKRRRAGV